jgi:hypothetical protein
MADRWELDKSDVARILAQLAVLFAETPEIGRASEHDSATLVARTAARKIPLGPPEGGHLRFTVRAVGPEVRMGGPMFPYTGWLEYGGRVGKDHRVHRTYIPWGRYLNPSYLEHYERIDMIMDHHVADACHAAGFEVD